MTKLEIAGVVFNLWCVVLTIRRSIWNWPVGIVGIVLFFVMFWQVRLYAELITQTMFFVLSIYGWSEWLRGKRDDGPLRVESLSPRARAQAGVLIAAASPALGFTLQRFTNASLPYWDSFITVTSLVAQWALARKYVENWALWIAVDVVGIGVYAAKGLYLTAGLYAVFLVLATLGLFEWRRALRK